MARIISGARRPAAPQDALRTVPNPEIEDAAQARRSAAQLQLLARTQARRKDIVAADQGTVVVQRAAGAAPRIRANCSGVAAPTSTGGRPPSWFTCYVAVSWDSSVPGGRFGMLLV